MSGREDHVGRVYSVAQQDSAAAASLVAASWRRCMLTHGLAPDEARRPRRLSDAEFREFRGRSEAIIVEAADELDRLFGIVGRAGCCLLLTDAQGVALDRRGSPGDDDDFRDVGLWPGTVWSEASVGTNGIGTAIADDRAVTIFRDQHFLAANTRLGCTTAPIRDHRGRLAAAIDVSTCREDADEVTLTILSQAVRDAAHRVEANLFHRAFPTARIVMVSARAGGRPALVAVDRDDLVLGATRAARQALRLDDAALAAGLPAADLLREERPGRASELLDAERAALRRALSRAGGNVSAAAELLGVSRATLHRKIKRLALN